MAAAADALLGAATNDRTRAHLLASKRVEYGAWLQALPMSSLGLHMDDDTLRVAAGLQLGATLCQPHNCQRCGGVVDEFALHGLSCRKSQGCHPRHAAIDMLLQKALASARVPSHLEPLGSCELMGRDLMEPQYNTMEARSDLGLGCNVPRHLYAITRCTGCQRGLCNCLQSRAAEKSKVLSPPHHPLHFSLCSGDLWCLWS